MYRLTRFEQLVQLMPWGEFDRSVQRHGTDRYCKGFGTASQLKAMAYAQLSDARGLRDVQDGYAQHKRVQYHVGLRSISRSTLADANARRSPKPFEDAACALMARIGRKARKQRGHMVRLLDSTTIRLVGNGFEWTEDSATRDRGLKLHVLYHLSEEAPVGQSITAVNVNDVCEGRKILIEPRAVYVFDKAYCDYGWWHEIDQANARFVTRAKSNIALVTLEHRPIPRSDSQVILDDRIARFRHASNRAGHRNRYTGLIRRIEVVRENGEVLALLTNDLKSPARKIAQLYKQRWEIELFFKWIKQHLQVKRFFGRSENAVRIQLLVALITYLLLLLYRTAHMPSARLWTVLSLFHHGLMNRPGIEESAYVRRRRHLRHIARVQRPLFT